MKLPTLLQEEVWFAAARILVSSVVLMVFNMPLVAKYPSIRLKSTVTLKLHSEKHNK
jgi:hypothetical protein